MTKNGVARSDCSQKRISQLNLPNNNPEGILDVKRNSVKTLISYVPQVLVHQILKEKKDWDASKRLPVEPFWAAVVFIDISGFSSLASDLQKEEVQTNLMSPGPSRRAGSGAENLTAFLNHTLRGLIDVVLLHGGDIVKFAGDAMIVIWRVEDGQGKGTSRDMMDETAKAKSCALATQCAKKATMLLDEQQNRNSSTGSKVLRPDMTLKIHVGVGCGQIAGFHVGGLLKRWEYFIMGEACDDMNVAEALAKVGEAVVSPDVTRLIEKHANALELEGFDFRPIKGSSKSTGFQGAKWQFSKVESFLSGYVQKRVNNVIQSISDSNSKANTLFFDSLNLNEEGIEKLHYSLRSYIPAPIVNAINEGEALTDDGVLRELCVLFVKLNNLNSVNVNENTSTSSLERVANKIQKTVTTVQEAAYHGRATLRQFIIDDKGAVAIIVVGLPPVTVSKNSSRGLKIALRILEHGVPAQIGITTGTCYCGTIGSGASRGDFAVVGDHINMSARLMSATEEGSIMCDVNTMFAARLDKSLYFGESKNLKVKGKKRPIKVYSPSRKIHSIMGDVDFLSMQRNPLVGNVNIWKTLQYHHHYRHSSKPQFINIKGKKTIGKTKIITMFQNTQKLERISVLNSRADKFDESTPYFAFRSILYNIFEYGVYHNDRDLGFSPHDKENRMVEALQELFSRSTARSDFETKNHQNQFEERAVQEMQDSKGAALGAGAPLSITPVAENGKFDANLDEENEEAYAEYDIAEGMKSVRGFRSPRSTPTPDPTHDSPVNPNRELRSTSPIPTDQSDGEASFSRNDEKEVRYRLISHPIFEIPNVRRCVDVGALDMEMVALLNIIVPSFEVPETSAFKELNLDTKEVLLQDLLVELIMTVQHPNQATFGPLTPNESPGGGNHVRKLEDAALLGQSFRSKLARPGVGLARGLTRGLSSFTPDEAAMDHQMAMVDKGHRHTRPVTLIIDDFHNCDKASIDLLGGILVNPDIGYSFILLTSSLNTFEFDGFQDVDSTTIEMERLTDNEISSVLFNEFALSSIQPALAKKIHETCTGIPGGAISYLRKLKDLNMLTISKNTGACSIKDLASLAKFVSDDIKISATHMYDNIDKRSQYILQLASTTGNIIFLPLLKAMYVESVGKNEQNANEQGDDNDGKSRRDTTTLTAISKKFKEEAFDMRLMDLIEAKVILIENGKLNIIVEGLAQVAYDVTLYVAKHDAHLFVINWYEENCTRGGLQMNASLLFHQSLSVNKYSRAARYLYKCCSQKLRDGKPKQILKLLTNSDHLLSMWKQEVLSIFVEGKSNTERSVREEGNGSVKRVNELLSKTNNGSPEGESPSGRVMVTMRGGKRRNSVEFKHFDDMDNEEMVHKQTLENIATDFSIVYPVIEPSMSDNIKRLLVNVGYCENRCKFFEAQVYIELKKFLKARVVLKEILQFCTDNGIKAVDENRGAWTFVKKAMGWKRPVEQATKPGLTSRLTRRLTTSLSKRSPRSPSKKGWGSPARNNSNTIQPVFGSPSGLLDKSIHGVGVDEDGEVSMEHLQDLFQSAHEVMIALKQLMTMQEQQQQVLRNIAANSRMDDFDLGLFKDSPNKNDSIGNRNSSNGANKTGSGDSSPKEPTSGKRAFASLRSNTPVFAVPTSNLKGDREFKLDFDGVGLT
ncbi:hypothetical protein TL16_g03198 [Triparma laevis f. inornata]|uniref:Guanylate cyclase domain-containing protein n=1 Tax=Triparma laevis f. inornata TaxID=1714386 RepID=A0A9W7A382_9STRA|nr:hypothetical protein TL16_g03198 [Triparma laevis f. inornata]